MTAMLPDANIIDSFREKVSREVEIEPDGINRYLVYTPFLFDDGDHFVVVLRRENDRWVLSDEGHTLMHLSYSDDEFLRGNREKMMSEALSIHGVENRVGELLVSFSNEAFGDNLFSFLQALTRVSEDARWNQERVKSTFWEDFKAVLEEAIPSMPKTYEYHDPQNDPDGNYRVDCFIPNADKKKDGKPLHVYAIKNDNSCREATISIMHHERLGSKFNSVVIYQDQTAINRRAVAQLTDVSMKQFSSLGERKRIADFFKETLC